jgi:HlyD family secretion protein
MRTSVKVGLGLGALLVLGLGAAKVAGVGKPKGTTVQSAKIEQKDIVSKVLANGKLQPRSKVDISANIPGQIVNLAVREGDRVEKGQFLLQIDQAQYRASALSSEANLQSLLHDRDAARANLEQATYDFEKAQRSFDGALIPESELQRTRSALDSARASHEASNGRVEQARASLEGARDSLQKTTIRAPLSGLITSLPVHEGEVAVIGTMNNPGTILMTVSDLSIMEADLAVDETDIPRLAVGQNATLTVDAYADSRFEGSVREVGSSPIRPGSDAATRTGSVTTEAIDFEVKVVMLDPPEGVRPGFSVSAEIETGSATGVPVVPIQALVTREQPKDEASAAGGASPMIEEGVYLLEEGKVRFVAVQTGLTGSLEVEVLSGIETGQEIVIGPFRALRELKDGDQVIVQQESDKSPE